MSKKLFISLAPLLAIAAFAVTPMEAQAAHYTVGGVTAGSEPTTVIGWGTLTLTTVVGGTGNITCHNASAGTIDNVAGVGHGSTQVFATYDCESTTCPAENAATAEALPWPSVLTEAKVGTIRSETTKVKVKITCKAGETLLGGANFVGANFPTVKKGSSALHPGFIEFDPASGELEVEGSGGTVKGKTEGEAKLLGYEEFHL